jgi:hypothetical protein
LTGWNKKAQFFCAFFYPRLALDRVECQPDWH